MLSAGSRLPEQEELTRCDNTVQYTPAVVRGPLPGNREIIGKLASVFSAQFSTRPLAISGKKLPRCSHALPGQPGPEIFLQPVRDQPVNVDPIKPVIHSPENYYFSSIKMQLY